MNRKNLTAAVLAGLAGAAGIAGTAQAVNMNPDGLGQVLIYPYYTANDGNQTILSVVNTTDNAKAVKVRFLEGFNSREVLDFNLYLSHHDVWVAAITKLPVASPTAEAYETNTVLVIPDDSCTVPYLYDDAATELPDGTMAGIQPFLNLSFTGKHTDGGPTSNDRVSEGHFEMIEMGTITPGSDTEDAITHQNHDVLDDDDKKIGEKWAPGDCDELVDNWTGHTNDAKSGIWFQEALRNDNDTTVPGNEDEDNLCISAKGKANSNLNGCGQATTDTLRNSGGLFGGAAIVHPLNGAMFSYDAKAVQGFDMTSDGLHYVPGTIHPSLNDGNNWTAYVFFGYPQNVPVPLPYLTGVDAVSAVFMHEFTMNEYTTADIPAEAATEWVVTFPTKNFYADETIITNVSTWVPGTAGNDYPLPELGSIGDGVAECLFWEKGDEFPNTKSPITDSPINGPGPWPNPGWEDCVYVEKKQTVVDDEARAPFTQLYGDKLCEVVALVTYDRSERSFVDERGGSLPPVVSPAPPYVCDPAKEFCADVIFELCNEVNVLRFGDRKVFGTPTIDEDSLLIQISMQDDPDDQTDGADGWGWIDFYFDDDHEDSLGMVGLPVTGFAAYQFENDYVKNAEGDDVKAFYGGLFQHKGNVRRVDNTPAAVKPCPTGWHSGLGQTSGIHSGEDVGYCYEDHPTPTS